MVEAPLAPLHGNNVWDGGGGNKDVEMGGSNNDGKGWNAKEDSKDDHNHV